MAVATVRGTDTYHGMMFARGCDPETLAVETALFDVMLAVGLNYTGAGAQRIDHLPSVPKDEAPLAIHDQLTRYIQAHPDNH